MKNNIVFSFIMMLGLTACAQQQNKSGFIVNGTTSAGVDRVTVTDMGNARPLGTVAVSGNKFRYELKDPGTKVLRLDAGQGVYCYIVADADSARADLVAGRAAGTPQTDSINAVMSQLHGYEREIARMRKMAATTADEGQKAAYGKARRENAHKLKEVLPMVIERNKDNIISTLLVMEYWDKLDFKVLAGYVDGKAPFLNSPMLRGIDQYVDMQRPSQAWVGRKFIDINVANADGRKRSLSEFVGRKATAGKKNYVLVDFWASWCRPCMQEMPTVKACWEKYRPQGFQVVGVSLDSDRAAWTQAISAGGYNWIQLSDLSGFNSPAAATYSVKSIPWNFLCDENGTIIAAGLRGNGLTATLEDIYE